MLQTVGGAVTASAPAWQTPTLLNSWVNFGSSLQTASYMKDTMGFVHLRGVVKSGTLNGSAAIFTLPAGFRPGADELFTVQNANGAARTDVTSTGNVVPWNLFGATNGNWSLSGITFKAEG